MSAWAPRATPADLDVFPVFVGDFILPVRLFRYTPPPLMLRLLSLYLTPFPPPRLRALSACHTGCVGGGWQRVPPAL